MKLVETAETRAKEKAMREAIERKAAEIRLALLAELAQTAPQVLCRNMSHA